MRVLYSVASDLSFFKKIQKKLTVNGPCLSVRPFFFRKKLSANTFNNQTAQSSFPTVDPRPILSDIEDDLSGVIIFLRVEFSTTLAWRLPFSRSSEKICIFFLILLRSLYDVPGILIIHSFVIQAKQSPHAHPAHSHHRPDSQARP